MKRNHAKVHFPSNRISFKSFGRCCRPAVRARARARDDFSSLIKSRDTDDHICHCMSTQKVHRSIVKMIVKFLLITVRSTTLDAFYCDFLYLAHDEDFAYNKSYSRVPI